MFVCRAHTSTTWNDLAMLATYTLLVPRSSTGTNRKPSIVQTPSPQTSTFYHCVTLHSHITNFNPIRVCAHTRTLSISKVVSWLATLRNYIINDSITLTESTLLSEPQAYPTVPKFRHAVYP